MQLVARVEAEVQHRVTDQADPFLKVRGLISDMLARLEDQAHADASQKAYCDKEMQETAQNLAPSPRCRRRATSFALRRRKRTTRTEPSCRKVLRVSRWRSRYCVSITVQESRARALRLAVSSAFWR